MAGSGAGRRRVSMRCVATAAAVLGASLLFFSAPLSGAQAPAPGTAAEAPVHRGADAAGGNGHGEGAADHGHGHANLGETLPLWSCIPFACMLLSIAFFPLLAPRIWHHHFGKISALWAASMAIPFLIAYRGIALYEIVHIILADYVPFIILLWSLYTVSGGILLRGTLRGTPPVNTLMLVIGTLLASWMGTTGAAMLMIRPFLRANEHRKSRTFMVVFFIFLVANIGGSLTPLGDPPLFLGFLHGVSFFWTLHILPARRCRRPGWPPRPRPRSIHRGCRRRSGCRTRRPASPPPI